MHKIFIVFVILYFTRSEKLNYVNETIQWKLDASDFSWSPILREAWPPVFERILQNYYYLSCVCVCLCACTRSHTHTHTHTHTHIQSCPTLCNPLDCSPPGSSVHGIFWARILEWVAISSSPGDLPDPGIVPTPLAPPALAGFFTTAPPGKPTNCLTQDISTKTS